ncbi:MAG: XrtA/PEP-CTERM system histidine kinase PrsK [Motiliproteus sp.]
MSIAISYLLTSLSFFVVLLLSLFIWRGRLHGIWLIQVLLVSVLWAGFHALNEPFLGTGLGTQAFVEILRDFSWAVMLLKFHSLQQGIDKSNFWKSKSLRYLVFGTLCLLLANLIQFSETPLRHWIPVNVIHFGPFVLVFYTLYLLEQWYRNIARDQRWSVKFFAIALAVIFGYDFVLYSEALLYNHIDSTLWSVRGWITVLMVPLIVVSIKRAKRLDDSVRLSHRAAFYSTGLLLAGIYLLAMAMVGYYLRWFGGSWGSALQVVFIVITISSLALFLASGKLRALISVWISKHFFPYKYDYREEWIRANRRFAVSPTEGDYYDQMLSAFTAPIDAKGGVLWTKNNNDFVVRSVWNRPDFPAITSLSDSDFLEFCKTTGWIIELEEYHRDSSLYNNVKFPDSLAAKDALWLLVPLLHQDELQGFVGLAHPRAARTVNWEDRDLLKALGGHLAALLALRSANEALTESRQFEAFNRLSAFVVHDLKNVIAQLSLVVTNAERHKHNPEFIEDALDTLANAVNRMNRLLSQLRQQSELNKNSEVVESIEVIKGVERNQREQRPSLQLREGLGGKIQVERERMVSVLCHLVQNAQEATDDDGTVELTIESDDRNLIFVVRDTGTGMDEDFIRDRLFKPFDTTKGRAGMGIGVYEAQQTVIGWGGQIDVKSRVGEGTVFKVVLPLYQSKYDQQGSNGDD